MHTKITGALKVSTLALVLSVGISYVYAWTAPTAQPPGGNVAAPINTSAIAQVKSGTLSATDLGINGNLVDTNTTIPATPAGGTGAVAGNNWPNFSDVAANAVKLAGLTASDILAAQTAPAGAVGPSMITFWSGSAVCATGWTKAFSGRMARIFYSGIYPFAVGVTDTNPVVMLGGAVAGNSGVYFTCVDSATTGVAGLMDGAFLGTSCTVCAR